jgi:hypothetical protein
MFFIRSMTFRSSFSGGIMIHTWAKNQHATLAQPAQKRKKRRE